MNNKITYHREGSYFIPGLYLPKQPDGQKSHHQMEWVQAMNSINNRAE